MKLFNTISIEISSLCNRKCAWCPVAYNERPDERMDGAVLDSILRDLHELNYAGRIELYVFNEPTKDMQYLLSTIEQVHAALPRACIMIATNGDYLRGHTAIMKMFQAGLNQLLINCYTKGLIDRRRKWVDALPPTVRRDLSVYSNTGPHRHVITIEDKHDPQHFGTGVFSLTNRAGNITEFSSKTTQPAERMCVRPFRILNINWKGEALICCQDYHNKVKIGNVMTHGVEGLWNHPVFTQYRRKLYVKDRSMPLCDVCDCHAGAYPHNVSPPD